MRKLIVGKNDLATLHPEVAAEADGWDPSLVISGSNQKMSWKCKEGHTWKTSPTQRCFGETGCPECAVYGFNPGEPSWFYLMERPGEQQFGITNHIKDRISHHARNGWTEIEKKNLRMII